MTPPTVGRVERSELRIIRKLGDGGQGIVHLVAAPDSLDVTGFATPGGSTVAYKEYMDDVAAAVDWTVLDSLVAALAEADADARAWLHRHTAWPAVVVTRQGKPQGFLMRLAPDDCFATLRTTPPENLLAVEFLLNGPDYAARVGLGVTEAQGLSILRSLAEALVRLHGLGVAIGDLSAKNVLFALGHSPRCFLIDCDAMSRNGVSVLDQVETADWKVPAGEPLATPHSDVYKLGLLAIRVLAGDQSTTDTAHIPTSMTDLAAIIRRSLSPDPSARPGPVEWVAALDAAIPVASTALPTPSAAQSGSAQAPFTNSPGAAAQPGTAPSQPTPPRRRGARRLLVGALTVIALIGACTGVVTLANQSNNAGNTSSGQPSAVTGQAGSNPNGNGNVPVGGGNNGGGDINVGVPTTPAPRATAVGTVNIAAVATNPRAADVARLFDSYFSGINNRQYEAALALYDPANPLGSPTAQGRVTFVHDVSTTNDSGVQITSISDGGLDGGVVTAVVVFRSRQSPGFGPKRNPNETCSIWTVSYSLTEPQPSQYRILRGPGTSTAC